MMTTHGTGPVIPTAGPIASDIVLGRDGTSVTLAQAPGLPQIVFRSFSEAVRCASAFAAAHDVDVWCAVGRRHWSLVATYRPRGAVARLDPAPLEPARGRVARFASISR